jgi:hypothetical protein
MQDFREQLDALNDRIAAAFAARDDEAQVEAINARLAQRFEQIGEDVEAVRLLALDARDAFDPELPDRPQHQIDLDDGDDWLFDSARSYDEQLAVYHQAKGYEVRPAADRTRQPHHYEWAADVAAEMAAGKDWSVRVASRWGVERGAATRRVARLRKAGLLPPADGEAGRAAV